MTDLAGITRPKLTPPPSTLKISSSFENEPPMKEKLLLFFQDFICGAGSGAVTGAIVGPA